MLTLKTGKYKRSDYRIMLDAISAALSDMECHHSCEICPNFKVCGDFNRLKAFVSSKYNHELGKREH